VIAVWITLLLAQVAATDPVAVGTPTQVAELDSGKLKGQPKRLAWSPDSARLYLLVTEQKNAAPVERHYLIAASGGAAEAIDGPPEWASKYWAWKSAQAAPGAPDFKIEIEQEEKVNRATAAPMGGDLARGGTSTGEGTSVGDATSAAYQTQNSMVYSMKLKGQIVGEFVNGPIVPGLTFGWSPQTLGLIAFAHKSGKVMIMDRTGRVTEINESGAAVLPAWSEDGGKLAFLRRDGRSKYKLMVATVTPGGSAR
jgi:hypothetical protein